MNDLRNMRRQAVSLVEACDALLATLDDPAYAPDLAAFDAEVTWHGRTYRVVSPVRHARTGEVNISLTPIR